ncbi:MAG: phosphoribosylanthranilate isomerase [Acidimicrobiales bacterium]
MWVKICGITNEEDALMAVALGADAIGFVFAPSPRQVTVGTARDIARRLPPEILTVGVFRDQDPRFVSRTVLEAGLRGVQLHGHESPAMAAELSPRPQTLIVAFAAGSPAIDRFDEYGADAMLLDAASPGGGKVFDWDLVDSIPDNRRLILAGGLTPDNVGAAVARVNPWGVDVSSGVESSPGQKDPRLVQAFIRAALAAEPAAYASESAGEPFDWHEAGDL